MSTKFTVEFDWEDLSLLRDLPDPDSVIRAMVHQSYAIFASQHSAQPNIALYDRIQRTCEQLMRTSSAVSSDQQQSLRSLNEMVLGLSSTQRSSSHAIETAIASLNETQASSLDIIQKLPIMLSKSQKRGEMGEACLLKFLEESLCQTDYNIEDVSKKAHSGDILIMKRDFQVLCDGKFYTRTVPKTELTKLKTDMNARHVRCGLLISFDSGVAGCTNTDLEFYTNDEGKLCCVAVLGKVKDTPERITMCVYFLETVWKKMLESPIEAKSVVTETAKTTLEDILTSASDLSDLIRDFDKQKKVIEGSLCSFQSLLMRNISTHTARIEERLRLFSVAKEPGSREPTS